MPGIAESMETLKELASIVGSRRVAWRYDPVLLTRTYSIERHKDTFARMAAELAPYIDRCVFSFVEMYRKVERNMPELVPLNDAYRNELAEFLGATAARHGFPIQICGTDGDYSRFGIRSSGCMTLDILGRANGVQFRKLKHNGIRAGCHCIETHDIGAYDTCLNGCKYCYANRNPRKAFENFKYHDPKSPLLLGHLRPEDIVTPGAQRSYIAKSSSPSRRDDAASVQPDLF